MWIVIFTIINNLQLTKIVSSWNPELNGGSKDLTELVSLYDSEGFEEGHEGDFGAAAGGALNTAQKI